MFNEIGSEFWIEEGPVTNRDNIPEWLLKFRDLSLTSSGRGAISLMLEQISPRSKTVLLPSYICESIILPFIERGYKCYFYDINLDLSPNIDSVNKYEDVGVFLHMGYFGFQTNVNLEELIKNFKESGTIVVEDVTHTLFSDFKNYKGNDFYIGSIRKWLAIPSGGFLASQKRSLPKPKNQHSKLTKLRLEALTKKGKYMKNQDDKLKKDFLYIFNEAEDVLDKDVKPYKIDDVSLEFINNLNIEELIYKRRKNFQALANGLKSIDYIKSVFGNLEKGVCPLFYPIYIKNNRNKIRNDLTKNKIYCPIHWPISKLMEGKSSEIYNSILSIPCDQRYEINDMRRIISILENIKE